MDQRQTLGRFTRTTSMSQQSFDQFRELVLQDPALQTQLMAADDLTDLVPLILKLGRERGYEVASQDVEAAWQAARRAWIERWI
jgi:predicted ribosomally synthesized peptide with nif11-like leader